MSPRDSSLREAPSFFARNSVLHTARIAQSRGISLVPIRANGTKQPDLPSWREYQHRCASEMEIEQWFSTKGPGVAFITGQISGNLEALDFDDYQTFEAWRNQMQADPALASLYDQVSWGYLESTPAGGRHLLYRCAWIEGNQKLATRRNGDRCKTLIETRGEGGLIIVAPSCGKVHPSGTPYLLIRGGVSSIQIITAYQREQLFAVARQFDEQPDLTARPIPERPKMLHVLPNHQDGCRPGDVFNRQASWEEVLTPYGWRLLWERDGVGYWTKHHHVHATTNYGGSDLLYVFSTSTKFEPECGYSKFAAYTLLHYDRLDCATFAAAARELAAQGYR